MAAQLEKNFPGVIEDKKMHRAVPQVFRVDDAAEFLTDHRVVFIHHIEDFLPTLAMAFFRIGVVFVRQVHPLPQAQFLGAGQRVEADFGREVFPRMVRMSGQEIPHHFAALGKPVTEQAVEQLLLKHRKSHAGARGHGDHAAVHRRTRHENVRRQFAQIGNIPPGLAAQGEEAVEVIVRFRA